MEYLLLNGDGTPCNVISRRKRLMLNFKGKIVDTSDPSVVMLRYYVNLNKVVSKKASSKKKIFLRDQYVCAYCGKQLDNRSATIDHIVPRSMKGRHGHTEESIESETNKVTCCVVCNRRKSDKTLEESGMVLLFIPKKILGSVGNMMRLCARSHRNSEWEKYT